MEMNVMEILQRYMGTGLVLIWFLLALVYLFIYEKKKPLRILLIYVPVIILLLYFNPLFSKIFYRLLGNEIYFRICWLLPVLPVIAYTVVCIVRSLRGKGKLYFAATAILLVMVSGKLVYTNPLFSRAENIYHVPQVVVDICDAIEIEGREVMALFPDEFLLYVRQYSPVVCMPYGRDANYFELHAIMTEEEIDVEALAAEAKYYGCHYVILSEEKPLKGDMSDYDYEVFDSIGGYIIYKDTTMNFGLTPR